MLLHAGAGMHQHEYSRTGPQSQRPPSIRSPFSASAVLPVLHDNSIPSSLRTTRRRSGPPKAADRVSFREPEAEMASEDSRSCANSDGSEMTAAARRRNRNSMRLGNTYALAQSAPLPIRRKLLHIRPKLLFQLQRLSSNTRPIPTIDVLASTIIVPRLANKFPRMLKGKGEFGSHDVMILKSEDYSSTLDDNKVESSDGESLAHREVIAVMCRVRGAPHSTEICLRDGSIWYAAAMRRGVYEFVKEDPITGTKITARWVPRAKPRPNSEVPVSSSSVNGSSTSKYNFSILNPSLRRHPVLASLTQTVLDIPDQYATVPRPTGQTPPISPVPSILSSRVSEIVEQDDTADRVMRAIDDDTRTLIQITGVWVALRLGWCPNFKYDDAWSSESSNARSSALGGITRSASLDVARGLVRGDTGTSPPEAGQDPSGPRSGKFMRSGTQIFRNGPAKTHSPVESNSAPTRAASAGAAFMQRAAARRANLATATIVLDSDHELLHLSSDSEVAGFRDPGLSVPSVVRSSSATPRDTLSRLVPPRAPSSMDPASPSQKEHVMLQDEGHQKARVESFSYDVEQESTPRSSRVSEHGGAFRSPAWKRMADYFRRGTRKDKDRK
ncbi:MAG: hypothetical protein M1818_001087 [Claussenomyces sp. TS43310]|nr:MAG: hypothetical protein M1818_001087 [Claussenomyces sp. TS43310]